MLASLLVSCGSQADSGNGLGFIQEPAANQEPVITAPTNLSVKAFSAQEIRLSWNDNSNNEEGFIVEKSFDNISFAEVGRVGSGVVIFSDFTTAQNQNIYYRVSAFKGMRTSTYSQVARVFHYLLDACQSAPAVNSGTSGRIYPFTISGLNYVSDNYSSVTDHYSAYKYGTDKVTSFAIGYIPIGQINTKPFLSLTDMIANINTGANGANNMEMNLLRLLLALDGDNNSANGIQLPCQLSTASGDIDFSLNEVSFENQPDVISLLNGKTIPSQLAAAVQLRSAKFRYYAGNYRIYISKVASGMFPLVSGNVDFTLNVDGSVTMNSFSGTGLGWIKTAVFLPDDPLKNLYFRAGDTSFAYDLRIDAKIEPDYRITGTFRVFTLLGDIPGDASGSKY